MTLAQPMAQFSLHSRYASRSLISHGSGTRTSESSLSGSPRFGTTGFYFVDADEWVSPQLADEISTQLETPSSAAFAHRLRLIFLGRWIRHCGWYTGSLVVRLVDRRYTKYNGNAVGERACVDGPVHRLKNDIVDEDLKGLPAWLHKHVNYSELEAKRRGTYIPLMRRIQFIRTRDRTDSRPLIRMVIKDILFPSVPIKPAMLFVYMYIVRLGFLDGRAGLLFCFYHAWYEVNVNALQSKRKLEVRNSA